METTTIERDGRTICFHATGSSDADRCVVFVHPSPGSGAFDPDPEQTARRDVLLVGIDRPSFGGTDPGESAVDDIAAVLDHLGFTTAGVAGWSTGGHVAAHLAVERPELVERLVLLGTPAPTGDVLSTLDDDPPAWLADVTDAAVSARLDGMLEHGRAGAGTGTGADGPSAFDPAAVHAKTLLLYGYADTAVGPAHARWWKSNLADSRVEMMPGVGHVMVVPGWKRALSHLAPRRKS